MGGLDDLGKLVALCKRRGFIFPSAEIYGGFANTYDYGPLGVLLKNNVRDAWIRANVQLRDDMELLDAALITSPKVWKASGHVDQFADDLVQCLGECKSRYRADHVETERCPKCDGELSEPRSFNTMFKTQVGPVDDEENIAYLPPETAQGMFVNFANVASTMRRKLPFGIAQVRKSFRNEITPGNFVFRTLEFEQMEIEYFVEPGTDEQWFDYWVDDARTLVRAARDSTRQPAPLRASARQTVALFEAHDRYRVSLSVWRRLGRARRHRQSQQGA